jgi:uncharacterized small protein (DUF1192 family)
MIKLSGSIARKRKKRQKKTRSRSAWELLTRAESGFRSFETGDYSNEIMGLASTAGSAGVAARPHPAPGTPHKIPPSLQILTIRELLRRVVFMVRPV